MKTRRILLLVTALFVFACGLISCGLLPEQHEHTWENATCETPKTCSECGETDGEALGHVEETLDAKAATCTETGLTEGKKCSVCDKTLVAQEEIPANGHTYDNACDTDCNVCDAVREVGDHVYDNACDTDCNECGATREVGEHVYDNDCDADCNECGATREVGEHGYDNACDVDCNECGAVREVGEHVYDNACDTTCNECGAVREVAGHDIVEDKAVAPTCEATGLTAGEHCSICDYKVEQEVISALGHEYQASYTWSEDNSTCTASGTCTNEGCDKTVSETATVSVVTLSASATKVTYTYKVEFENESLEAQTKSVEGTVELADSIATINAPAIADRVASNDYVKFGFHDAEATYTFDIYYSEVDVWDGTTVSTELEGEGTEENPYLIQSAADFAYFAGQLNAAAVGQAQNYQGKYFKMTVSIDLNNNVLIAGNHSGWNKYQGFGGIFDGNNCSIRGINVEPTTGTSAALFGCITKDGTLKNLAVYGNVTGKATVGGVVAYLLGTMDNVTSYATITATAGTIGGVVANQENSAGAITNCVNYGNVTSTSYIVGGIAGSGGAAITNCTNWGNVTAGNVTVGGIAGTTKEKGTISGCVNYGTVTTTSTVYGQVGGIAGLCKKPVDNCVNYGEIIGIVEVGGICGNSNSAITNCVNNGRIVGNCETTTIDGITSSNVTKTNCVNNGSVVLEHSLTYTAAVEAGCETEGNVEYYHCSICEKNYNATGEELASVVISATGHDYEAVVTPPTCEADGYTTYTCKNGCGSAYTDNIVKAGHKDENGDRKCDTCGENICAHVAADAVKENEVKVTCTSDGSYDTVVYCSVCDAEISREKTVVTALGHNMNGVVEGTVKTYTCENGCGLTEVKYLVTVNYLFADGGVAAEADVFEYDDGTIYTIDAKAVEGYEASQDYVKGHILSEGGTVNIYYSEIDVWDGTTATAFDSGSGTADDPYIIKTGAQLAYLAKLGMDGTADANSVYGTGIYYKLGASLDLSGHQWIPIAMYDKGYSWTYFDGNFDGANHKIIININNASYGYGLFAGLGASSVVKNLFLDGSVTTAHRAGALAYVSQNGALVENVTNYAAVTGTATGGYIGGIIGAMNGGSGAVIKNCVNYGKITSAGAQVGGMTGTTNGTVTYCVNYGEVTCTASSNNQCGGISGATVTATITYCVNYGTVNGVNSIAGIGGYLTTSTTITNSVNYGTINGTGAGVGGIGGVLGAGGKTHDSVNYGTVTNTAANTAGIIGDNRGNLVNCTNYGTISGTTAVGGIYGKNTGTTTDCVDNGSVETT